MDIKSKETQEMKEELINENISLAIKNHFLKKRMIQLTDENKKYLIENLSLKFILTKDYSNKI